METDKPKLLANPEVRVARLGELRKRHIARLTVFVEELRSQAGPGAAVPYFDPWDGGVNAEILFLLEAPGPKAVSTGFVSRNNPDETAKNFFELCVEAQLERRKTLLWNAVPWYIGSGTRIRAATRADLEAGLQPLPRLLQLLPRLKTVVLVGKKAQSALPRLDASKYTVFTCPHPSPMFVNRASGNRIRILDILKQVRKASLS